MAKERKGGCHCGKVRFRVAGELRPVIFCHCADCLKIAGGVVAASGVADEKNLTLEESEGLLWYQSSQYAKRGFCRFCGASLFYKRVDSKALSIFAGTLDNEQGISVAGEIFAEKTPAWNHLAGHLNALEWRPEKGVETKTGAKKSET